MLRLTAAQSTGESRLSAVAMHPLKGGDYECSIRDCCQHSSVLGKIIWYSDKRKIRLVLMKLAFWLELKHPPLEA